MPRYIIGIDEAGRGPLAGPVAVGVVLVPRDFDWDLLSGVTDSKKLSEIRREKIFKQAKVLEKRGKLRMTVSMVSAGEIDRVGITTAIERAMARGFKKIMSNRSDLLLSPVFRDVEVLLDGGLRAPQEYLNQRTIIKGDQKEKVIGLASIMAKVTRDRYMVRLGKRPSFQSYDFHIHKGYGTEKHRAAIKRHGISSEHRECFCKNILKNKDI